MLRAIDKIDLYSETPARQQRLIAVIEAGEWQLPEAKWLLQEKLNAYAIYALDGQMHQMYPDSIGKPVSIVICPVDPIPPDIAKFIDQIAAILAQDGLTVTVEPLPAAEAA
jgi:hypothetical protein